MRFRILGGGAVVVAVLAAAVLLALGGAPFTAHADSGRAKLLSSRECRRDQLVLSVKLAPPAMGHAYVMYVLRNRGRATCSLAGTPRLTILHAARRPAPAMVVHSMRLPSALPVTLAPRRVASFMVDAQACEFDPSINPAAPTITQITLPGQSMPFSFTSPATTQCARQELAISPIGPGEVSPPSAAGP